MPGAGFLLLKRFKSPMVREISSHWHAIPDFISKYDIDSCSISCSSDGIYLRLSGWLLFGLDRGAFFGPILGFHAR
jgi:hypothetical protein